MNSESPITEVPSGGNDYLEAQSGVFVLHDWSHRDYWREEYNKNTESPAQINARFIRLELPSNMAGELLDEIRRRGVDVIGLFPGISGFVSDAADFAWKSVAAVRG